MMVVFLARVSAVTTYLYVAKSSPINGPGTAWSNAFHTVQQAIDEPVFGSKIEILVTNGVYDAGEKNPYGTTLPNRVYVDKTLMTIRSVNGPTVTIIKGQGPNEDHAVRCLAVAGNNTLISGFTLTDGHSKTNSSGSDVEGGGVLIFSGTTNVIVENCVISNCYAKIDGGGVCGGIYVNCEIVDNMLDNWAGSGASSCELNNCTIKSNTTLGNGGAVYNCTLNNCIVWENRDSVNTLANHYGSSFNYSCTLPLPTNGVGNISTDPQFVSSTDSRLSSASPCMDSGENASVLSVVDLDGHERIYDGTRDGTATVDMGCYESIIMNHWFVDALSPQDGPGTSWATAYRTIQSAIIVAQHNDVIIVTNGTYATSGLAVNGDLGSRVAINKEITVQSVNGPEVTIIQGFGQNGPDARRCAYVGTNACLVGFTLTGGHTRTNGSVSLNDMYGGGAWCEPSGVVSNCIITANEAFEEGGGVYNGTLHRCIISSNAAMYGAGANRSTLYNCLIVDNVSGGDGGGGCYGVFNNCTISSNSASGNGGGLYGAVVQNSIIWGNTAPDDSNWFGGSLSYCCTTPLPSGTGNVDSDPAFFSLYPYHPSSGDCLDSGNNDSVRSEFDLEGEYRILDSDEDGTARVDMGCYERFMSTSDSDGDSMPDGWERDYGLNYTDPSDAAKTADSDRASNLEEYIADTDPTNSSSYLSIITVSNHPQFSVYFHSSEMREYTLMSCSHLSDNSWTAVPGAGPNKGNGNDVLTDTNQPPHGPYYSVKVQVP